MRSHRHVIFLLAAASPAVIDTGALIPTGKWTVEYAANACVPSRDYGYDRHRITLALRPLPQGTGTEVVLLAPGGGRTTVDGYAQLTLLPTGRHSVGTYQRVAVDRPDGRVAAMTFDGAALDGLDKATIELGLDNERHLLAMPDIAGAMKALDACQADLLKGWGIDVNERATVATPPRGHVARLFPRSRYPEGARARQRRRRRAGRRDRPGRAMQRRGEQRQPRARRDELPGVAQRRAVHPGARPQRPGGRGASDRPGALALAGLSAGVAGGTRA